MMHERNMKKGLLVLGGLYAAYVIAVVCVTCLGIYVIAHFIGKYW